MTIYSKMKNFYSIFFYDLTIFNEKDLNFLNGVFSTKIESLYAHFLNLILRIWSLKKWWIF